MDFSGLKKGGGFAPEICGGNFVDCTNRSGWIGPAGPIHTDNSGTQTLFTWTQLGGAGAIVSPDCITDAIINVDFGHMYYYLRRMRAYFWADVRLLVNGAPVLTQTTDQYLYDDKRDATPVVGSAPLSLLMDEMGNSEIHRLNIPANSTISAEAQIRYNFSGAQDLAYGRIIRYGLRSKVTAVFLPKTIVTGEAL